MINIPPYLKPGDTIGITCPAGFVAEERISFAVQALQAWGYHVITGTTVGSGQYYMSGTDEERRKDLQSMLDNPLVNAIIMGRGGYGTSRIIDGLDFSSFIRNPKWICGFSDITVLHSHILANYNIATLHSPMCGAFTADSIDGINIQSLKRAFEGASETYTFAAQNANRNGRAEGILTGGNLALLAHLTGSASQVSTDGKILFIEDIGEHWYNIDRMLLNLKRSGQLSNLAGLLVGSFTDMEDTERKFGYTLEEIVLDKIGMYDYPVAFGFPCGHGTENVTLRLGQTHELRVAQEGCSLIVL